jgi:signal transduction histidine kinase
MGDRLRLLIKESTAGSGEPGAGAQANGRGVDRSPAFRQELLDPAAWQEGLEKYAAAMHMGVALADTDGRLLGPCLNPRPLWSLLRGGLPADAGACPFAVDPLKHCSCAADALKARAAVWSRDRTSLIHFAVPLVLEGQPFGALIAGQVFDNFPEQLALEQAALRLGLSPAQVWQAARLEHPVSPSMLRVYEELLATLGQAFLQSRYHALLEAARIQELRRVEEALRLANEGLEQRVEERTAELRQSQERTLQAERLAAIGRTVTALAHEGRNALQRAHACLARLELRQQGRPDELDLNGRTQAALGDLERLFDDVRAYAAPVRLECQASDLGGIWREAWAQLAERRQQREARLEETDDSACLVCDADPFRLRQVFLNLFTNVLEACPDPVRVTVSCREAVLQGRLVWRVSVRDNGPGFPAEQRSHLFEPFHSTKPRGTGLGLAICRRIVEAQGGTIQSGDASPGAEVVITLPRERDPSG